MTQGFLQISNELLDHPTIQALNDRDHRVLINILRLFCFAPCQQDDHGQIINLRIGQYMFTYRKLALQLGVSVGALQRLIGRLENVGIAIQEVIHTKSILTLSEAYIVRNVDTPSDTKVIQDRYKSDTQKNKTNKTNNPIYQETTPLPPKPADSVYGTYSCLNGLDLSAFDKKWISNNFSETVVKNAVAYVTHPATEIKTTLTQTIKWACKEQPPIPTERKDRATLNRNYALERFRHCKHLVECNEAKAIFHCSVEHCEIGSCGGNTQPTILTYEQKHEDFKRSLDLRLACFGLLNGVQATY